MSITLILFLIYIAAIAAGAVGIIKKIKVLKIAGAILFLTGILVTALLVLTVREWEPTGCESAGSLFGVPWDTADEHSGRYAMDELALVPCAKRALRMALEEFTRAAPSRRA